MNGAGSKYSSFYFVRWRLSSYTYKIIWDKKLMCIFVLSIGKDGAFAGKMVMFGLPLILWSPLKLTISE